MARITEKKINLPDISVCNTNLPRLPRRLNGKKGAEHKWFVTNTVEPRFNEPLYNEVLGITNDNYSPARPKLE